jgi:radical SAM enzyme (TIGR01210 family)
MPLAAACPVSQHVGMALSRPPANRLAAHHPPPTGADPAPADGRLRPGAPDVAPFPTDAAERTRWILARRGSRPAHDVWRAHGSFWEREPLYSGAPANTLTLLLTSRECPWHCAMCDLWRFTVPGPVPEGAMARQIAAALAEADGANPGGTGEQTAGPGVRQIKLYNGGSFFDPKAVPPADYPAIARAVAGFDRVIVECHPALVGPRAIQFQALLREAAAARPRSRPPVLEVAMGLETVHPVALEKLNKRMSLDQFRRAATFLAEHEMALRVFVLVQPPFQPPAEAVEWARRSADFAFHCGASAVTLIPTRPGNGALEALRAVGDFTPPTLRTFEETFDAALDGAAARVFADLWNLETFSTCPACFSARRQRLAAMNLDQRQLPRVSCPSCRGG